ncbi:hypothetical protein ARC78_07745 [Stenotrophomonas pictorum JCM 9942]|uniref:Uncharacterized protein n=1 Tax=Stenotrophomonas pictorum JCM 9942 TaxID=1236960 RepID=A0A0R0APB6_9GAMM|nr:hypothetical protein [Stenotrophomonas pictorum]KRG42871.1 hypothetical protein ARC78_07745 [Stenotrophomonas pictorum JCM 9942]
MMVATRGWQAMMAGLLLAGAAQAQQTPPSAPAFPGTAGVAPPIAPPAPPTPAQDKVTTLEEVRALKPEDEQPLDLYRFKSPVAPAPNRFSKSWSEPPTPEQVSLSGGYLFMGINYGLMAAAKGLHKLTNGRDQIQSAIARPPPEFDAEQQRRALLFCQQQGDCPAPPGS